MPILLRLLSRADSFITINISTGIFAVFAAFAAVCSARPGLRLCSKSHTATGHFLVTIVKTCNSYDQSLKTVTSKPSFS